MKFSTTTCLAILATTACVQAAPFTVPAGAQFSSEVSLVKKSDINDIKEILAELSHINSKRDYVEDEFELAMLNKRADGAISNLLSALANSGIIGDVLKTLTTDPAIKASVAAIVKSALQTAVVQGPALLSAIWNSGLLGRLLNDFLNDADLRSAIINVIPSLLQAGLSLLNGFAGAAAPAAAPVPSKRELIQEDFNSAEYLDKRDLASVITWVVDEIKSSGIVSNLINKVLANPQQSIDFLTTVLKEGIVVFEDVYGWAKQSGLLDQIIAYLGKNGGSIFGSIANIVGQLIGGPAAPASAPASTPSTFTPSTSAAAAAAPVASGNSVYADLAAKYGGTPSAAPAASGNSDVNSVFAAAQAAKRRRNY